MASCSPCRDRRWSLDWPIQEESEGKAMFTGSLVALITPFKNGSVDEKGFEKFVAWQIKEGTDGLVPVRHHRRIADALHGRAQAGDRHLHRRRQGQRRAGDRRHRLELDRRGDRAHPARQEGRRRRRHAGRALLQQADPGRPVPAFQDGGRGRRHPDPALQRAAAHRRRHAGRHRGAALAGQEHHRHQGRELRHGAPDARPSSRPRRASCSSRARMPAPWASWRRAATAASR